MKPFDPPDSWYEPPDEVELDENGNEPEDWDEPDDDPEEWCPEWDSGIE